MTFVHDSMSEAGIKKSSIELSWNQGHMSRTVPTNTIQDILNACWLQSDEIGDGQFWNKNICV